MPDFYQLSSISFYLIIIALWGIMQSSLSLISILIAFELGLLACCWNFIIFSLYVDDIGGQVFALIILCVAGAESALGLAAVVAYARLKGNILVKNMIDLKA
jgi:NADH:ubiquinone oxidoreductase subunit K